MTINLFSIKKDIAAEEIFETIIANNDILIERIVSKGHFSPSDFWYDQGRDEWVSVLQGQAGIMWENGEIIHLHKGDWILIPAHKKHRVAYTTSAPPCIWLAVHGHLV
jgi:cupin 2 domain-containing protein